MSYATAVQRLQSLIAASRAAPLPAGPHDPMFNVRETRRGLEVIGLLHTSRTRPMRVVHVAGTKGKGSTAIMCEALLHRSGLRTATFTSPHLMCIRERIRLDGVDISQEAFAGAYFAVEGAMGGLGEATADKSAFFRWLTWMFFHAAAQADVDVAVVEVGLGGRCDATNALEAVTVSGITAIGHDHCEILGDTLPKIAFEKAGILKAAVPCYVSESNHTRPDVMDVFLARAAAVGTTVSVAPAGVLGDTPLGLGGAHMRENASLAVALARTALGTAVDGPLTPSEKDALATVRFRGRCEVVVHPVTGVSFYLDGAHTIESIPCCVQWFKAVADVLSCEVVIVFNCMPPRDPTALLSALLKSVATGGLRLRHVYFAAPLSSKESLGPATPADTTWQATQAAAWGRLAPDVPCSVCALDAAMLAGLTGRGTSVLVTGSLYLVGDVMSLM